MRLRVVMLLAILALSVTLLAPTAGDQYGAAAWRILKTMMGTATCASGSLCMFGGGEYYVSSFDGIQDALDNGCGEGVTGTPPFVQSGCIINLAKGIYDNGGVTINLAGTGTGATGRAGVTFRGTGGGTAAGTAGEPLSGTIIKSGGAVPVFDIGVCYGCTIENLTIAGEDSATVGIDILSPSGSQPTTRLVLRNIAIYEVNGYCIRTGTSGQVDTMLFENVSCRDSDGAYQQRDNQTIGAILTNFDANMLGTASGPVFDIQEGDFTLMRSYVGIKHNETMVKLGKPASRVLIDGNQLEFGASTSAVMFDFDEGTSTTEGNITVSNNHIVFEASGNTLFDVQRKGSITVSTNSFQDVGSGGAHTLTSDFMVDDSNALNRLYVNLIGNMEARNGGGGVERPVRWIPTLTANPTHGVYPTLSTMVLSNPDPTKVTACIDGELLNDSNAAAGSASVQKCLGGAWVAL